MEKFVSPPAARVFVRGAHPSTTSPTDRRPERKLGPPVGVLGPPAEPARFAHVQYRPSPDLADVVEHYWIVRWDLRGHAPREQATLPHPSVHLVVEAGHSGLFGVVRGRFAKHLAGRGRAVGVKFRPGGFRSFWPAPVHTLTGRVLSLSDAFGAAGATLESAVLGCDDDPDPGTHPAGDGGSIALGRSPSVDRGPDAAETDARLVAHLETFLRVRRPACVPPHPHAAQAAFVAGLVERITKDRSLTSVDAVARAAETSPRTVQRLFRDYVGVSVKWVLCRQRLHEAATHLADGAPAAWTRFALDLGYYDQAHFVRSFTALVGSSPAAYVRLLGRGRGAR